MKRIFSIVTISVFVSLITLPMIAWQIFGLIDKEAQQQMLATGEEWVEFPSEFNAKTIMSDLDAYFNRTVPFRSTLVNTRKTVDGYVEKPYQTTIRPALQGFINKLTGNAGVVPPVDDPDETLNNDFFGDQNETEPDETETEEVTLPETTPEDETLNSGDETCQHENLIETVEKEATCTEFGEILHTCPDCDYSRRVFVEKLQHNDKTIDQLDATCTEDGSITYQCQSCQRETTNKINKLGHDMKFVKTVEANKLVYGYTEHRCDRCKYHQYTDFVKRTVDKTYMAPSMSGSAIFGREDWLFYPEPQADYQGTNVPSQADLANRLAALQRLQNICDEKGITLQFMVMPNKWEVYSDFLPYYPLQMGVTDYQQKKAYTIREYVKANSDIKYIYPIEELLNASRVWQTYFRYDTHWNYAGAYVGLEALYKSLEIESTSILYMDFEPYKENDWHDLVNLGGLSLSIYNDDLNYNINTVYRPDVKPSIAGDIMGNGGIVVAASPDPIYDGNFVMLGDSFRISMIPYLTKDFAKTTVAHQSNIWDGTVVQNIKDADVIVIASVERYQDGIWGTVENVANILSQP